MRAELGEQGRPPQVLGRLEQGRIRIFQVLLSLSLNDDHGVPAPRAPQHSLPAREARGDRSSREHSHEPYVVQPRGKSFKPRTQTPGLLQACPSGTGFSQAETGRAVVAPAVTNAIFAATAKRIRTLPIDTNLLKSAG